MRGEKVGAVCALVLVCAGIGCSSGSSEEQELEANTGGIVASISLTDGVQLEGCRGRLVGSPWRATCDADGNLSFQGVWAGEWDLEVTAVGRDVGGLPTRTTKVAVNADQIAQVDITMFQGGAAHGHLVANTDRDLSALVTSEHASTLSTGQGLFFLDKIPPGTRDVAVFIDDGVVEVGGINIEAGQVASPVDVPLAGLTTDDGDIETEIVAPSAVPGGVSIRIVNTRNGMVALAQDGVESGDVVAFSGPPSSYWVEAVATLDFPDGEVVLKQGILAFSRPSRTSRAKIAFPNPLTIDMDKLGDLDQDGIFDAVDADAFNPSLLASLDSDGDGVPDGHDFQTTPHRTRDSDGDGVADGFDNCAANSSAGQLDDDGDGIGNACDSCPGVANADQVDANGNGIGDACEGGPCGTSCDCQEGQVCRAGTCTATTLTMANGQVRTLSPTLYVAAIGLGNQDGRSPENASGSAADALSSAQPGDVVALSENALVSHVTVETPEVTVTGGWMTCADGSWRLQDDVTTPVADLSVIPPSFDPLTNVGLTGLAFSACPNDEGLYASRAPGLTARGVRVASSCNVSALLIEESDGILLDDVAIDSPATGFTIQLHDSHGAISQVSMSENAEVASNSPLRIDYPSGPIYLSDLVLPNDVPGMIRLWNVGPHAVRIERLTLGIELEIRDAADVQIDNVLIEKSAASGVGIDLWDSTATVSDVTVNFLQGGTGLSFRSSDVTVDRTTMSLRGESVAGISATGTLQVSDVTIEASGDCTYSAGIKCGGSGPGGAPDCTIRDTVIVSNRCTAESGNATSVGIEVTNGYLVLERSRATGAAVEAPFNGGNRANAVRLFESRALLQNSYLSNGLSSGGLGSVAFGALGAFVDAGGSAVAPDVSINASTIVSPLYAIGSGVAGGTILVNSSILENGVSTLGGLLSSNSHYSGAIRDAASVVNEGNPGVPDAEGDIFSETSCLAAAGDPWVLAPGSECINAGSHLGFSQDLLGQPRSVGGQPDIGAYELQ